MDKKTGKNILLLSILLFSFSYRFLLMTWNTYPPGADIGLHESVVNSIMSGRTDFFWNKYHMGGGVSVTNPGYHIFIAMISAMTEIPDYLVHALVASIFSTLIVLVTFLIVKKIWSESASFIAAFLVAFSAGDIEILSWAGYPNIITLMLIPTVFYLFLQRPRFSSRVFIAVCSLLIGTIFLTHIFSALVFTAITLVTLFVVVILRRKTAPSKIHVAFWLLPIFIGVILASPYLLRVAPVYFSSESAVTGAVPYIRQAILETRLVPLDTFFWVLIPAPLFFMLSRAYGKKWLTIPALFFAVWTIIPAIMTQSYVFGIYLDYERFLYFSFLPMIVCVGLLIERGATFFSKKIKTVLNQAKDHKLMHFTGFRKFTYSALVLGLLIFSLLFLPIFSLPNAGYATASSYQVMNSPGYEGIQWIRTNTSPNSVCVADAYYGWWLSGFAQRPTLSAVDPQYLIMARELEPAKVASDLLDTCYYLDNGIIQVKYDGAFVNVSNPEFLIRLDRLYAPYLTFQLIENEITVLGNDDGASRNFSLTQMPIVNLQVENSSDHASILVNRTSQLLTFTEEITVYRGIRFANVSVTLKSNVEGFYFNQINFPFITKGFLIQDNNTVAAVDASMQILGQIINNKEAGTDFFIRKNPRFLELVYDLGKESNVKMQFFVGIQQYQTDPNQENQADYLHALVTNNTENYMDKIADLPIQVFDYQTALKNWNISYIIIRDQRKIPRFTSDPLFSLVFENTEVAIFKVKSREPA